MSQQPRSIFGPLLLIAIGAVWLLTKMGTIPAANLWALTYVWPYLLIAAGLGIILRAYWKYANVLLDVIVIGGVLLSIVYAPALGWDNPSITGVFNNGDYYVGPGVRGSGKTITETREVSSFHAVEVNYPAEIHIKQGSSESVKVEAEDNLMPSLRTEVKNGTLNIFYKKTGEKHVNPTEPVVITITVKNLDEVDFSSAGKLTIDGLKADELEVLLSGAGDLEFNTINVGNFKVRLSGAGSMSASGTVNSLDLNISGFGDFKGEELQCKNADVNISGAGSATVWAKNELHAGISGAGSVNYYGSPEVTKNVSGLGSVNHSGNK